MTWKNLPVETTVLPCFGVQSHFFNIGAIRELEDSCVDTALGRYLTHD